MKKAYTIAGRTVVALSLSLACAMPVLAQNTAPADTAATTTGTTTTQVTHEDNDRDYGWIGLLGLAGLLGLRRKRDDHHTEVHRTTTTTNPR